MALSASLKYANTTSGNLAGAIGWVNFGTFALTPGQTVTGVTATLRDGSTITFDITNSNVSGSSATFTASTPPVYSGAPFGVSGYTGINANVVLYSNRITGGTNPLTLNNITLKDPIGNPIPNYFIYVANGETTGSVSGGNTESQRWLTNGGGWQIVEIVGTGTSPTLSGTGTQDALLTGIVSSTYNAPVLSTLSPTQISTTLTDTGSGLEGVVFGVAITKIEVQKNIVTRTYSSDQFILDLTGTPSTTMTTTGNSTGLQSNTGYAYPGINQNYTLTEQMAPGSGSTLSGYITTVAYANLTPGGTPIPTTTTLPATITVNEGDMIIATVTNAPAPEPPRLDITKLVDKASALPGATLTYTLQVKNPVSTAQTNVIITDAIPSGTTFVDGSVTVGGTPTGDNPANGITISTLNPSQSITITFKVLVGNTLPTPNPIPNTSSVKSDQSSSSSSNTVTTLIIDNSRGIAFI